MCELLSLQNSTQNFPIKCQPLISVNENHTSRKSSRPGPQSTTQFREDAFVGMKKVGGITFWQSAGLYTEELWQSVTPDQVTSWASVLLTGGNEDGSPSCNILDQSILHWWWHNLKKIIYEIFLQVASLVLKAKHMNNTYYSFFPATLPSLRWPCSPFLGLCNHLLPHLQWDQTVGFFSTSVVAGGGQYFTYKCSQVESGASWEKSMSLKSGSPL